MLRKALLASVLLAPLAAHAQNGQPGNGIAPPAGGSGALGFLSGIYQRGSAGNTGSLIATTTSATIASLITSNAGNAASWPTASGNIPTGFYAQNFGGTDVAICLRGGTCTCVENGVANTNGTTVKAGSYFGFFGFGTIAYNVPTIVACSGSDRVEIDQ